MHLSFPTPAQRHPLYGIFLLFSCSFRSRILSACVAHGTLHICVFSRPEHPRHRASTRKDLLLIRRGFLAIHQMQHLRPAMHPPNLSVCIHWRTPAQALGLSWPGQILFITAAAAAVFGRGGREAVLLAVTTRGAQRSNLLRLAGLTLLQLCRADGTPAAASHWFSVTSEAGHGGRGGNLKYRDLASSGRKSPSAMASIILCSSRVGPTHMSLAYTASEWKRTCNVFPAPPACDPTHRTYWPG